MLSEPNRKLITCRKAAEILGVTMGRVRQMTRGETPVLWSDKFNSRVLVLDAKQVRRLATIRRRALDAGVAPGRPPGGFQPDS